MSAAATILLTFDYELFLGRDSGTPERSVLAPTRAIAELLERHGAQGVFFVDTLWLLRARDEGARAARAARDIEPVLAQIAGLAARGHEVFMHLHPHWRDAVYDAERGRWRLDDLRAYRLHALAPAEIAECFARSAALLAELAPQAKRDGFRAGGWCLQPFGHLEPHLRAHGLRYDLSVVPGTQAATDAHVYDYRAAPCSPSYRFGGDPVQPDPAGWFVEVPASLVTIPERLGTARRWLARWLWRVPWGRSSGDGVGVVARSLAGESLPEVAGEPATIELLDRVVAPSYRRHLERTGWLHLTGHPKMVSRHNLGCLDRLLGGAAHRGVVETRLRAAYPLPTCTGESGAS